MSGKGGGSRKGDGERSIVYRSSAGKVMEYESKEMLRYEWNREEMVRNRVKWGLRVLGNG